MPRHDKSPTVNCCRVLFITYWHKFQMIFIGFKWFQRTLCRVRCRHGVSLLLFRRRFPPFVFFIYYLYLAVIARLMSVMCTNELLASWVDTPLTADWLQVCFGTGPTQFSKAFLKKMHTPPLISSTIRSLLRQKIPRIDLKINCDPNLRIGSYNKLLPNLYPKVR